jgi:DNA-binding transcriptional ArsR family regulator
MISGTHETSLIDPDLAAHRASILKALGNPVRLRMMAWICARGEATVGSLADKLELPQSTISRQLSWLRLHGLVEVRKESGFHHYSLAMPQLATLLQCLEGCDRRHDSGGPSDGGDM